jgi:methenyltetrahydrofolate cyclohydrolase
MTVLADLSFKGFLDRVADGNPTPGGGSVAALCGALSGALCTMVARLTLSKEKYHKAWQEMEALARKADALRFQLVELTDKDADAYNSVVICLRMPKGTNQEKKARKDALERAIKEAALVPCEILRITVEMIDIAETVIHKGNTNCLTDAAVAVQTAGAAAFGAAYNIRCNLSGITDMSFRSSLKKEVMQFIDHVRVVLDRTGRVVDDRLG